MDYMERYEMWKNANLPEDVMQKLTAISGNDEALKGCCASDLQFGTAGMRGIMDVGSNRLNRYTVRRAAQGMAAWLSSTDLPQKAAIGYDSRHNSRLFAEICAVAFAEVGIHAYIYDRLAPTPMLSYAVRALGCGCGIVISASHNSGEYNGVKCYGPDGCQMTDEPAAIVTEKISQIPYFVPEEKTFDAYLSEGMISYIESNVWEGYYNAVYTELINPDLAKETGVSVVYTPLCGTGREPVTHILNKMGVQIQMVTCQEQPDGDFKTCEYPNPETDAALNESYKVARNVACDLILGTDPDADRVAIAVPCEGGFQKLTGNELGCMLMEYILQAKKANIPQDAIVVRSIVSTPLADRIAARYGVTSKAVLTGFKYIGGEILKLEETNDAHKFLFGFEESCGYLKGTYARDKDAVVASALVCEMAAFYKKQGKTLLDALADMYSTYGQFLSYVQSVELKGADAMEKAAKLMADLRENIPATIGGVNVTHVRDYSTSIETNVNTGEKKEIPLPKSNVLEFILGEQGSVIVRPSGTEPKVKYYYTAVASDKASAQKLLDTMKVQMTQ